jgi:hypothetical protein
LGVPTENQFRRVSYPETQRTRMTRRQFLACIPAAAALKGSRAVAAPLERIA